MIIPSGGPHNDQNDVAAEICGVVRIQARLLQQTGRIRTKGYSPFLFAFFGYVIEYDGTIGQQLHAGHEGLQEPLFEVIILKVTIFKTVEPQGDVIPGKSGAAHLGFF